jgi:hypothetical protein
MVAAVNRNTRTTTILLIVFFIALKIRLPKKSHT